jgi:serine/threonine-protein kinase
MDETLRPEHPQTIGRYQVQESVGYGAMGAVYKAFDPLIKRTLAIKTIRLDIPRQSPQYKSFIERFYHEARISGTLSHPNIVTLFDIGEEAGVPYLAMEFVEGETLSSILERGIKFPPEKVIGLISQIASAVDYAHSKGVIHRDIKPSNLILYEGERVKVTDFGIAKLVDAEITHSGTLLGTPSYMSPEQAMGDKLDGRSDIFSLGVCAFEMLSGEQPFPGTNVTSILYKLVHVDPIEPPNLEMNGLVPQKWHEVFGKVLAKRPDDRYQTATDFVQDLEYCLGAWFGAIGEELGDLANVATARAEALEAANPAPAPPLVGVAAAAAQPRLDGRTDDSTASYPAITSLPKHALPVAVAPDAVPTDTLPPGAAGEPAPATVMLNPASAPITGATVLMGSAAPPSRSATDVTLKSMPPPPTEREPLPNFTQPVTMVTARPAEDHRREASPPAVSTSAAEPMRKGSRGLSTGVILGLAGLLTLAAVVLGMTALYRRLTATPGTKTAVAARATATAASTPAPVDTGTVPAAPSAGVVHVETDPAGASVTVDGRARGVTPLDVGGLDFGSHDVKVELKGYEPKAQGVMLTLNTPRSEMKVPLARTAPVIGSADILSSPSAATVSVDGATVGNTPLKNWKLKPGTHNVQIEKDGHEPWSGTVAVQAGKRARLDVPLKAIPKPAPQPTPEVVDPARTYEVGDVDVRPKKVSGEWATAPKLKSGERISVGGTFVVTDGGEVTDVRITESGGKSLDESVAAALRKWKYAPGTKRGVKVKVRLPFKQTFTTG